MMIEHGIINVINLEHRDLRLKQFHEESVKEGFGYRVWPGIICQGDNKRGICLAHKQIVQYAKDNHLPYVAISEDDCRFFGNGGAWRYYLDKMPVEFDIYFSMVYVGVIKDNRIIGDEISGMTMYIINQRFYDFFLSLPDSCHIDRELGQTAEQHKYIVCDQFVCQQDGSRSDHNQMTCDYSPYLKGRKLYGSV